MVDSHESSIQIDDWRTSRIMDTLFHAEKTMPGVWQLLKSMKEHEGVFDIEIYSDRIKLEIKDAFKAAWEKVGEDPGRVEVRYRK